MLPASPDFPEMGGEKTCINHPNLAGVMLVYDVFICFLHHLP